MPRSTDDVDAVDMLGSRDDDTLFGDSFVDVVVNIGVVDDFRRVVERSVRRSCTGTISGRKSLLPTTWSRTFVRIGRRRLPDVVPRLNELPTGGINSSMDDGGLRYDSKVGLGK